MPSFADAFELHRNGRLAEAEVVYRQVLAAAPGDVRTLYHLALVLAQSGKLDNAARVLADAVTLMPSEPALRLLLGSVLAELGLREQALAAFAAAASFKPDLVDAHFGKGNVLFQLGRWEEAAAAFARAESLAPHRVEIVLNLGSALLELGRAEEALAAAGRAVTLMPTHSGALNNRGNALRILKRYDEALADFDSAIAGNPDYALARFNRATVLKELRRFEEARAECDTVLALAPDYPAALSLKGLVLLQLDYPEDALASFERALALQPDLEEAYHGWVRTLLAETRWEEALAACDAVIARQPDSFVAHNNRGTALLQLHRVADAVAAFERAIALDPACAEAYFNRSGAYYQQNRIIEAYGDAQQALALKPDFPEVRAYRFSFAATLCDWSDRDADQQAVAEYCQRQCVFETLPLFYSFDDPEMLLDAARRYANRPRPARTRVVVAPRERLRIAYLSADFRDHPVAHQAIELFERHDRTRVETYAISLSPTPDTPLGHRLRGAFDHHIEMNNRSDRDVAQRVADLKVDIAVELGGYTDMARPDVLSWRPAPVSVIWLGYPGTLGSDFVDYIIGDRWTIPPDSERYYTEKVVRLPISFMPSDSTLTPSPRPTSRAEQGLPDEGFVFCDFNKSDKFTPAMFDIWMRILKAVPGSVLWLNRQMAPAQDNLRKEAAARGVDPARIVFAGRTATREDHLARLTLADLFLDTYPYNAHATTADFLNSGVPVLTLMGKTFAARVAAGLLAKAGAEGLITSTPADYEHMAIALARDPEKLAEWRRTIAAHRHSRADTDRLARALEDAYFTMWEQRVRGEAPAGFDVI